MNKFNRRIKLFSVKLLVFIVVQMWLASTLQRIPVDPIRVGQKIPLMNDYVPEPGYGYPSEFRITDCW